MDIKRLERLVLEGDQEAKAFLERMKERLGEGEELCVDYSYDQLSACMGTLKIKIGDRLLYEKACCCTSTGSYDSEWGEEDESSQDGELLWDEGDGWPDWISIKVREVLADVPVCCGGCL